MIVFGGVVEKELFIRIVCSSINYLIRQSVLGSNGWTVKYVSFPVAIYRERGIFYGPPDILLSRKSGFNGRRTFQPMIGDEWKEVENGKRERDGKRESEVKRSQKQKLSEGRCEERVGDECEEEEIEREEAK